MSKGTRLQKAAIAQTAMEEVLEKLKKLDVLDDIKEKIERIDEKLTNIDTRQVVTEQNVQNITERVGKLEVQSSSSTSTENRLKMAIRNAEISKIRMEENTRQYNVVIGNIPQADMFENRKVSLKHVRDTLTNVLQIPNADRIVIRNAHRLPAVKGRSPIIFKLNSMYDKQLIWDNISKLNTYNDNQLTNTTKVFIDMYNLPPKLQRDKKSLLPTYKK